MAQFIVGTITALISILSFIYISFTAKRKGPILSNTYLLASPEERKNIDTQGEYRLVTRVFGLIAFAFLFFTIFIFTEQRLFLYLTYILLAVDIIYAIYEAFHTEINS